MRKVSSIGRPRKHKTEKDLKVSETERLRQVYLKKRRKKHYRHTDREFEHTKLRAARMAAELKKLEDAAYEASLSESEQSVQSDSDPASDVKHPFGPDLEKSSESFRAVRSRSGARFESVNLPTQSLQISNGLPQPTDRVEEPDGDAPALKDQENPEGCFGFLWDDSEQSNVSHEKVNPSKEEVSFDSLKSEWRM